MMNEKEKSTYQIAYEEEKKKIALEREEAKKERAEERLKRAAEKAKRDARNPLFKRLAQKLGASGKGVVEKVAADIGRKKAQYDAEREVVGKSRRMARLSEMSKIAAVQEREKVRASMMPRKVGSNDFFGGMGSGDILGSNKSKKSSLDSMTPDLSLGKGKKKRSDDFFNGML